MCIKMGKSYYIYKIIIQDFNNKFFKKILIET